MRRKLLIAVLAGAGGAAAGALFSAVSLQWIGSLSEQGTWLLGISAGLGAFAGAAIGWICAATQARTGGRPTKTLAAVAIAFLVGIVVARRLFGHAPGGMQLLLAVAGAAVASLALRLWARWNAPASAAPRTPRSWRFQFTLATLLTLLTLVSIGLALYVRGPIRRHQVAKEIVRTGGRVRYGSQAPYWVVDLLGDVSRGFFNTVTEIEMHPNDDADLKQLHIFSQLRSLRLRGGNVTDDGMKFVGELRALDELDLGGLRLTDAALEHIQRLTRLRSLNLPSGVTGGGLSRLANFSNLETLSFNAGAIKDEDLRHLKPLRNLKRLWLNGAAISDAALPHVGQLRALEDLELTYVPISDTALMHLHRLTRLKHLGLGGTKITDAGLAYLGAMAQLDTLELWGTKVTGTGFADLDGLGQLHRLGLSGAPVTDDGLSFIGGLSSLRSLNLSGTSITDDGLARLGELTKLDYLCVSANPAITDGGLMHLKELPNLLYLDTANTGVTSRGLSRLEALLAERRTQKREQLTEAKP